MITKGSEWMRRTLNNSVFLALLRGREKLKSKRWSTDRNANTIEGASIGKR